MAFDPSAYRIAVQRQNIDGDMYYVGTVLELPDVVVYEESYDSAYSALIVIITDLKAAADDHGRKFPEPRPMVSEYSGRITLRMPQHLHRKVAMQAEEDALSINLYVVTKLAEGVGERAAPRFYISTENILFTDANTGGEHSRPPKMHDLVFHGTPMLTAATRAVEYA